MAIKTVEQLQEAINNLHKLNSSNIVCHHVSVFIRLIAAECCYANATETLVRAIQVLISKGELKSKNVRIVEYYSDSNSDKELHEHSITILPSGALSEPFKSNFFSLNDDLSLEIGFIN